MALTPTLLYGPAQPGAVTGVLATVPALQGWYLGSIILANTTVLPATVTIGIGGTAAANQIVPAVTVPANTVITLDLGAYFGLVTGQTVNGLQGTAGAVTVTITGLVDA